MAATIIRTAVLAFIVLTGAACTGVTPVAYTPVDEIPPGPGLLSGEDGEFTLYRR